MDYAYAALDRGYIPDFLLRRAIRALNAQRIATLSTGKYSSDHVKKSKYIESLKTEEIAIETDKANEQHYEVDTDFMLSCKLLHERGGGTAQSHASPRPLLARLPTPGLGKRAKYSCCLYPTGKETLDEAEGNIRHDLAGRCIGTQR